MGFGDEAVGRVSIVATELATNIVKHGGAGDIALEAYDTDRGIELLAIDAAPAWPTSRAAWRTAIRPPAARAPGSARSAGCPTRPASSPIPAKAP
ncbi:MAG: hypothetical protein WDO24_22425 [Pseudomonadota bacterium]